MIAKIQFTNYAFENGNFKIIWCSILLQSYIQKWNRVGSCLFRNNNLSSLESHHAHMLLSTHRKPLAVIPHPTQVTNYSLLALLFHMHPLDKRTIHTTNFYYARSCGFLNIISSASCFLLRYTQKPHFLITHFHHFVLFLFRDVVVWLRLQWLNCFSFCSSFTQRNTCCFLLNILCIYVVLFNR